MCEATIMSIRFLRRAELEPGKYYVTNINPSANDARALGVTNGRKVWDYVVGGPFDSREQAQGWLQRYPEAGGPYVSIELRDSDRMRGED